MIEQNHLPNFEQAVLPHRDAANNLARWLIRNPADAEDAVQEACLRALRFFDGFRGGDSRAWLLKIVRNTCYSWLQKNRPTELSDEFDETVYSSELLREDAEGIRLSDGIRSWLSTGIKLAGITSDEMKAIRTSYASQSRVITIRTSMKSNLTSLKASTTSELSDNEAVRSCPKCGQQLLWGADERMTCPVHGGAYTPYLAQDGDSEGFERLYRFNPRRLN